MTYSYKVLPRWRLLRTSVTHLEISLCMGVSCVPSNIENWVISFGIGLGQTRNTCDGNSCVLHVVYGKGVHRDKLFLEILSGVCTPNLKNLPVSEKRDI